MYTYKTIIEKVDSFAISEKNIMCVQDTTINEFNMYEDKINIFKSDEKLQEIYFQNNDYYVNTFNGNGILISKKKAALLERFNIKEVMGGGEIICFHNGNTVKYNHLEGIIKTSISIKCFNHYLNSNTLYCLINNSIHAYSLVNGNLVWEFDVSKIGEYIPLFNSDYKLGKATKIIGVYKNLLLAFTTAGKIIALDIVNGNLVWEKNDIDKNLTDDNSQLGFGNQYNPILDNKTNKVYMLQGELLFVLDLVSLKATVKWYSNSSLFIRQSKKMDDSNILFVASKLENVGNDDTIGIFNTKNNKISWQYTLNFVKENFIPNSQSSYQFSQDCIYVLDWQKKLHIFEKKNNNIS